MKRLGILTVLAALFIAPWLGISPPRAWSGGMIRVGLPVPLTGRYDLLGTRNLQGARLWEEWVNDQGGVYVKETGRKVPVKVVWHDTKSSEERTVKLTKQLIKEDKVHFLLGPYGSTLTLAAAPVTERYGKLMFSHSGASDKIWEQGYNYVIGVLSPSSYYYKSTMELLASLIPPARTLALMTEDTPFNLSIREGIKRWAQDLGFEIIFDEVYPARPAALSSVLKEVKKKAPHAILASSHFRDGVLLARQAAELGVYTRFFAVGSAPSTVEWWEAAGPEAGQYAVATSQWEPIGGPDPAAFPNWFGPKMTGRAFNAWFERRWGRPTDFRGTQGFTAGLILQWAIENAGGLATDKVRAALNRMDIMTLYGRQKIDPATGIQVGHSLVVAQWQDGKKVVVGPPDIAMDKVVYPRPE